MSDEQFKKNPPDTIGNLIRLLAMKLKINHTAVIDLAILGLAEKEKLYEGPAFSVYMLMCLVNAKVYIGVTRNPDQRRRKHFNQLQRNCHPNKELQDCYRQYGKDAFLFEVLESEIHDYEKYERERFFIAIFNSIETGFNTIYGNRHIDEENTTTWNGIKYKTLKAAAEDNGISSRSMRRRLDLGYEFDLDMKRPKGYTAKHKKKDD